MLTKEIRAEVRKSYFQNKSVIIAPRRDARPKELFEKTIETENNHCVFCNSGIEKDLLVKEYSNNNTFKITVLKNKFPVVALDNKKAYGIQEVIIDTPLHNTNFSDLSSSNIEFYFRTLADRLRVLSANPKIKYILQFKNHGSKAGASILHAHSQIFATSIIPFEIKEESKAANSYKKKHKVCPYCFFLNNELKTERKIFEDAFVGAIAPYASEYHYEAWIFPKRHTDNISTLNKNEIQSLAICLKKILMKLDRLGIAYNFFMHQVISDKKQHFYIKIQPRDTNIWAGIELGSGLIINSILPEKAAQFYQN